MLYIHMCETGMCFGKALAMMVAMIWPTSLVGRFVHFTVDY